MVRVTGLIVILSCASLRSVQADNPQAAGQAFFDRQVRPILQEHCFKCHGDEPAKLKGGLWLKSRDGVLRGGELGPVIDLNEPEKSLLVKAIGYENEDLQMPPKGKLPAEDVEILTRWVAMGVPWSGPHTPIPQELLEAPAAPKRKDWWSYQPLRRPAVPKVAQASWVTNPIDAFILAKLEANALAPVPPADKLALIRRATYDLTGLPPTPAEVQAFLADDSHNAYEKVIDRLLQSPHYGEKWARHWLDLVRYAETNGYERDGAKPHAWRYRDYVIRSLNEDKPYDQFVREQIAGDDLKPVTGESVIATGYYRLGIWDDEPADAMQSLFDGYDDILSTTGQVFLGMTINCARCHDHKVDPISQKDYYRFLAFFRDVYPYGAGDARPLGREASREHTITDLAQFSRTPEEERQRREMARRRTQLKEELHALEEAAIATMPREDQKAAGTNDRPAVLRKVEQFLDEQGKQKYTSLKQELEAIGRELDAPKDPALSVNNSAKEPPPVHVLIRGSPHAPGDPVEPGFPSVLGDPDPVIPTPSEADRSSGRRPALARWMTDPNSRGGQLVARVMANRLWQHHFGRGIVRSTNDFGGLGEMPTHPELLDWLAAELIARGWRLKTMHKLIMMSSAYRMSSADDAAGLARDPANDLFWRFDIRRLTAEEIRDSILALSGKLNLQIGGPSVYTKVPAEILAGASMPNAAWGKSPEDQQNRRSIYVFIKRSLVEPVLGTFDLADTDSSCPVRFATTVPTQALTMLNSSFFSEQAASLAQRLVKEAGDDPAAQAARALELALSRQATEQEIERSVQLMQDWQVRDGASAQQALEYFCLMVVNLNEFVYLD
jgi:hypothetical protein